MIENTHGNAFRAGLAIIGWFLVAFLILSIVEGVSGFRYNVSELPFNISENITFSGFANDSLVLNCSAIGLGNSSCLLTSADVTNFFFFNDSNLTVSFIGYLPNTTVEGEYIERYDVYWNGNLSDMISFGFNVSFPVPPANVSLVNFTPVNGSKFGGGVALPIFVNIFYVGNIDFNSSVIELRHNGSLESWITRGYGNNSFWFNISGPRDGFYSGDWIIVDDFGGVSVFNYSFMIKTNLPGRPRILSPDKGVYVDEELDLEFFMDNESVYTAFWLLYDGFPPTGISGWQPVSSVNERFFVPNIRFSDLDLGQIFLKVVDDVGNSVVLPSGIISGPGVDVVVNDGSRLVDPGDSLSFDVKVKLKQKTGRYLRCRLDDFVEPDPRGLDEFALEWSIPSIAYLYFDGKKYGLDNEFYQSIDLEGSVNAELELVIDVPQLAVRGDDYDSFFECLVTG